MRRTLVRLALAVAAVLVASPAFAQSSPADPLDVFESVAYADGPTALRFNPAELSVRYPSEFALSFVDRRFGDDAMFGALEANGFRIALGGAGNQAMSFQLGLGGGADAGRAGLMATWVPGEHSGHAVDWRFGLLSRPTPWLSLGGVVDHLGQPRTADGLLVRDYTLGVGLRPLAWAAERAHTLGTRLTLTADVRLVEGADAADLRVGGELELIPGLAVRGAFLNHDHGFQLGVSLFGVRSSAHAHSVYDHDGGGLGAVYSASAHQNEDRTVFAGPSNRRVAVMRVGGTLGDDAIAGLSLIDGPSRSIPVKTLHDQLERALEDPLTRGVLLDLRGVGNMAQLEELRPRIARLRAAGKPVVAYMETGGRRGDLYLASACDRIVATEEAYFAGLGLMIERRYYRKFLADWGVRFDRASYGKYKSAFRNYSVDSTTAADREYTDRQLDVVQDLFVSTVAADRHISPARVRTVLDGRTWRATDLQKAGLVDSIGYRGDAMRILGDLAGLGRKPHAVKLADCEPSHREWMIPNPIAVVYASGDIDTGPSGGDLLFGPYMGSETVSRQVDAAFRRSDVKAVVLRIESGGGSSVASDLIYQAVRRAKLETKKPLIVSMGATAASGGYNIALPGDRLYADRFTRTGSIGVLFVRPSLEGFYRKNKIHEDDFMRGDYMRGWAQGHDWGPAEQATADSAIMREYREFVGQVAAARGLTWDQTDHVAQGRVWMAEDALQHKLVDEIGGLEAAIAEARRRGGVPAGQKIHWVEYRRPAPNFCQRWVVTQVRETIEQSMRLPEPGEMLYWDEDLDLEP